MEEKQAFSLFLQTIMTEVSYDVCYIIYQFPTSKQVHCVNRFSSQGTKIFVAWTCEMPTAGLFISVRSKVKICFWVFLEFKEMLVFTCYHFAAFFCFFGSSEKLAMIHQQTLMWGGYMRFRGLI